MIEFEGGYAGRVAEYHLLSEKEKGSDINEDRELNEILYRYIGGRGLGVKLLYDNFPRGTDPLSSDNVMVLATGPLSGTRSPTPGRMTLTTKSPLTGTISTSNSGSRHFSRALKQVGFDALILKGQASEFSYLKISREGIEPKSAEEMRGMSTKEATKLLQENYGKQAGTAVIGPAAENGVLFANIHVDGMNFFGRGGQGTVLAQKNLKGIVVEGGGLTPGHANPAKFEYNEGTPIYEAENRGIANNRVTKAYGRFGTPAIFEPMNDLFGALPTSNFKKSHLEDGDELNGDSLNEKIKERDCGCYECRIACKRKTRTNHQGGYGPEYETLYALGSSINITDVKRVAELNYLCNELGLDTITTGLTLACAIDMFEDGIVTEGDTDGMKLSFESKENVGELIQKISDREGFGSLLAKGSYRLADHYDHPEYSMSVNKLELAGYDPRVLKGMALVFSHSNRGACHLRGGLTSSHELYGSPKIADPLTIAGKGSLAARSQDMNAYLDSLVACLLAAPGVGPDIWARLLTASVFSADGNGKYTPDDLMEVGERIYNLERWFNHQEGIEPKNYRLPDRIFKEEVKNGPNKGEGLTEEEYLSMEEEYYEVRGWENGAPTKERLRELKII